MAQHSRQIGVDELLRGPRGSKDLPEGMYGATVLKKSLSVRSLGLSRPGFATRILIV
jgi:hypothetical protein